MICAKNYKKTFKFVKFTILKCIQYYRLFSGHGAEWRHSDDTMTSWRMDDRNLPQSELTTLMGQWNNIQHCKKVHMCVPYPLAQPLLSTSVTWRHHDVISAKAQGGNMGTFSILFRMVLRSTPPIFSFVLIFSNLFAISTGLCWPDYHVSAIRAFMHLLYICTYYLLTYLLTYLLAKV